MCIAACLIVLGIYALLAKAAKPYLIAWSESREIVQVKQQIAKAEAENKALRKSIAYLHTSRGQETAARELGWVKEGETAVVVEQLEDAQDRSFRDTGHESFWQAAGRRITGLFGKRGPAR